MLSHMRSPENASSQKFTVQYEISKTFKNHNGLYNYVSEIYRLVGTSYPGEVRHLLRGEYGCGGMQPTPLTLAELSYSKHINNYSTRTTTG